MADENIEGTEMFGKRGSKRGPINDPGKYCHRDNTPWGTPPTNVPWEKPEGGRVPVPVAPPRREERREIQAPIEPERPDI